MPAMLPSATSYDEVAYESVPIIGTHPDRLSTLAQLMGVETPALATCRVLELGCAGGGNLVPMALQFPGAQFTGVDLSAVQVLIASASSSTGSEVLTGPGGRSSSRQCTARAESDPHCRR